MLLVLFRRHGDPVITLFRLEFRAVGELEPDDTADDDGQPESLHEGEGLIKEDGAQQGGADGADSGPNGVTDTHVDLLQSHAEEEQSAEEENDRYEGPREVGEAFAAVDA